MKTFLILKLCFCVLFMGALVTGAKAQIPTNGLVGYYPFNGNANDESGNQNNGIPNDVLSISDRFSAANKAYEFNGESSYIQLPSSFDLLPRTIDLWFNSAIVDASTNYRSIYQSDNPYLQYGNSGIVVMEIDGHKKLLLTISAVSDTVDINTNTWYNVAMVVNENNQISYYLDGSLLKTKEFSSFVTSYNGFFNSTIIGANRVLTNNFFKGVIDDIRIYNRVLYQREIEQIYNEGACANIINVMDTLIINMNLLGSNPVIYQNSIRVYPNPTSQVLNIDCGINYQGLSMNSIRITNSLGQVLFSNPIDKQFFQLDLLGWTGNGLYLIYILDSQNNIIDVRKILLQ
jgi:hypothetical protein